MIRKAENIARRAHKGQTRKWGGQAYIVHPQAVAGSLNGREAKTVAWLHDVVEDTDVTLDDLRRDFPDRVVDAVDRLTRRDGEVYSDFILRALESPLARLVKIADIRHNMATIPEGHGLLKRWAKALEVLER